MSQNIFMPQQLPLLSDYSLVRIVVEYRHASMKLRSATTRLARHLRDQIEQALQALERELQARGIPTQSLILDFP